MSASPKDESTPQKHAASIKSRMADMGYAAGWRIVCEMPEGMATRLFQWGADYSSRRNGGPEQLRKNLARVIGVDSPDDVPSDLIRDSLRSYARYWKEAFRLPSMKPQEVGNRPDVIFDDQQLVADALEGRIGSGGAVLVLPHTGNWDFAGLIAGQRLGSLISVAERLEPESLYRRFLDFRESLGMTIYPLTGGDIPPFDRLANDLRDNKLVCLLGDRDLRASGVEVEFFGASTRMPAGAAKLAQETGAALFATKCEFSEAGWTFGPTDLIDPSVGIPEAVQLIANAFERNISRRPQDWHMLQPLWLDDLSASHRRHIEG